LSYVLLLALMLLMLLVLRQFKLKMKDQAKLREFCSLLWCCCVRIRL